MDEIVGTNTRLPRLHGSSFESFEDAAANALSVNPRQGDRRVLEVVRLSVEEGGVVGRTQYHVDLLEVGDAEPPPDAPANVRVRDSASPVQSEGRTPAVDAGLGQLHPELRSRVLAATAHAQLRLVSGPAGADEYEVHALTDDRVVHMLLSIDPSGSVNEATETFVRGEIVAAAVTADGGRIEVQDAGGRRTIPVPVELAQALEV
jgi:hypothetical protein